MNRRAFLTGLIAAPVVIRVAPLMRISPPKFERYVTHIPWQVEFDRIQQEFIEKLINPPVIAYPGGTVAMFRGIPVIAREGDSPVG